ncbi:extracellular solute-binding protein [Paenibacillus radicis (ex Xue et al. 2023)]|uniref:Extracellular solute-binding protein n=1 Tax=Paenibacillus radicis (ex Xue et al. 2023) TaxID=2972489 RepID=A0ABT1YG65_9BACL|nr:extracellular solute-binding protein [Paenibacillus radicis (ex Xue et al. 2023)]MCR8631213.1 extracellular solute-binding protein [Paenibacillus radicis (ex Xue et al. 2023)]
MITKKKTAISLASVMLLGGLLSACGGGTDQAPTAGAGTGAQPGKAEEPLSLSIMTILLNPTPPADDNAIKRAIEKATNSKMNIQWVSSNSYSDKLNVTLASGDIADLTYINDPFSPVFRSMVQQGAFWDITNFIKDYPNLSSKISKTAWDLTKMEDGKNYSIPRPRPAEADSYFILRKDWLDAVGMKPPTTTDELYQVLKAFAENDPDKNGKKDTIAFTANVEPTNSAATMGALGQIENSFTGVNGNWKLVDGKMVFVAFLPEARQAIEFMTKLVKEKLIPEDFASMKSTQVGDLFKAGKAGMITEKAGTMINYFTEIKKTTPSFKETDFFPLTSVNNYNPKGPGFAGTLAIPKSVPEAKMKRILKLVDTWMNDNVFDIQTYGMEGIDHTVKDGVKVVDSKALTEHGGPDFNQIVYVADPYASSTKIFFPKEANELYKKIQDDRTKNSVADISIGLYSPTMQQFLPEFVKNLTDLKTKILLGSAPITAWDDYINKMKNDPNVVKMSQEITDAYKKRAGK